MDRPPDIYLGDLAEPLFAPEIADMLAAVAPMAEQLVFDVDALCEAASAQAGGLDDFGSDLFREPFEVLCRSIVDEGQLSPTGLIGAHSQLVQFLVNRLRVADVLARHPEIHDIEVARPIVIAGMPRSGTTHLHNLMSADPALRSLPWWESLEPVPPADEWGTTDGRIERAKAGIAQRDALLPHFDAMHEMTWDHVHEEIHLLAIAGSTMLFDTMGVFPSWREWYTATDQTPYYGELKDILKVLTWLRGGERWVLKSPQHLEQFGPLVRTFPDASFVVTHRDPVSITASFATLICYGARMSQTAPIDIGRIGRWWAQMIEDFLAACVRDRDLLPSDRSIDIRFDEFMADDVATVEAIYAMADQPFDDTVRAHMEQYMATHPRGRHGRVLYDLEQFGIDRAERRAALQFYVDRFGINIED